MPSTIIKLTAAIISIIVLSVLFNAFTQPRGHDRLTPEQAAYLQEPAQNITTTAAITYETRPYYTFKKQSSNAGSLYIVCAKLTDVQNQKNITQQLKNMPAPPEQNSFYCGYTLGAVPIYEDAQYNPKTRHPDLQLSNNPPKINGHNTRVHIFKNPTVFDTQFNAVNGKHDTDFLINNQLDSNTLEFFGEVLQVQ